MLLGILPVLKKGDSIGMESYHLIISLIEGASDLIHSVDSDGCFEFVNNAWLETLGYDESELDSLFLQDIIYPDHLDEHLRLISATLVGESNTGGIEGPIGLLSRFDGSRPHKHKPRDPLYP